MKGLLRNYRIIGVVLVMFGMLIGLFMAMNLGDHQVSLAQKSEVPSEASLELNRISSALSQIAESVSPSVVNVSTTRLVRSQRTPFDDLFEDPFFRRFFGDRFSPHQSPGGGRFRTSSLGSGVIVSANGHVLTNNHVIQNAEKIVITLQDEREFEAELIGADPRSDLALLKIEADELPALVLDEDNDLRVGELVVAIGIPFGLSHTVTMGIVSAVGRSNIGIVDYEDFIQTDAAINPGNSGGALVNSAGELVGINTAIFSTSGGYMGVGFAIPAQMVKSVMASLIEHGRVVRGWLGVSIQDLTRELAEHFELDEAAGALISDVLEDSPASQAGLRRDDIIVAFDGQPVVDATNLKNLVAAAVPDSQVTLTIIRDGKRQEIMVELGELPGVEEQAEVLENGSSIAGLHLQNLTPELRRQLEIPDPVQGVLVTDVDADLPAYQVLQRGDIIMEINRQEVSSVAQVSKIIDGLQSGDSILLLVYRNGSSTYLTITMP